MRTIVLIASLVMAPALTWAGDEPKAFDAGYQVGKDVAELKREVAQLRALLQQLLELDKQRAELLEQALAGQTIAPSAGSIASPSRRVKPVESAKWGTVRGKVDLPKGERVAYVYVADIDGRAVRNKVIRMGQKDRRFSPTWAVVQKGTTIEFPNFDGTYHNVFADSDAAKFDLGIYRAGDAAKSHVFRKAGDVDVHCNMHAAMSARVLVVPNHMFARVGADGRFELSGVPTGARRIAAWSPGADATEASVSVKGGDAATVTLSLKARPKKPHLNKEGKPYGSYGQ